MLGGGRWVAWVGGLGSSGSQHAWDAPQGRMLQLQGASCWWLQRCITHRIPHMTCCCGCHILVRLMLSTPPAGLGPYLGCPLPPRPPSRPVVRCCCVMARQSSSKLCIVSQRPRKLWKPWSRSGCFTSTSCRRQGQPAGSGALSGQCKQAARGQHKLFPELKPTQQIQSSHDSCKGTSCLQAPSSRAPSTPVSPPGPQRQTLRPPSPTHPRRHSPRPGSAAPPC